MSSIKLILSITLLLLFTACSGSRMVTTHQTETQITVDGSLSDWNIEQSVVDRSDAAHYYAAFDDEYLYLFVDVRSAARNSAMRQSGFIIYLSDNQENRKRAGIAFPSGTFNLLRENPGVYNSFINDEEWSQNPQNRELLEDLQENIFDRIMIIEQSGSDRNRGFINKDQLQVDGIEIASDDGRRLLGIEMRVPLNDASLFNLSSDEIWLGFEIDPPNFRIRNDQDTMNQQRYGGQRRPMQQQRRNNPSNMRHMMGAYEQWFHLNIPVQN
ncbi:hypothetical protein [Rhodohalobacter sp. SW132]|uniref:hypothetical protein n=1 Tax=Rhodohalobacter sp. SW132 TaxID=2293433 RepID=UPI0011C06553|nr:hypothetical protein [Rhodohalobacter sp. SW132]